VRRERLQELSEPEPEPEQAQAQATDSGSLRSIWDQAPEPEFVASDSSSRPQPAAPSAAPSAWSREPLGAEASPHTQAVFEGAGGFFGALVRG
jgi:hypothetical protein